MPPFALRMMNRATREIAPTHQIGIDDERWRPTAVYASREGWIPVLVSNEFAPFEGVLSGLLDDADLVECPITSFEDGTWIVDEDGLLTVLTGITTL